MNSPDDPANKAILTQFGATIHWRAHMVPGLVSINCPQLNAVALAQVLSTSSNVKYAETVVGSTNPWPAPCNGHEGSGLVALDSTNVHSFQWARKNSGETIANVVGTFGADANLEPALQVTTGNPEIVVAVIDSCISINHPALLHSLWTNQDEIAGDNIDNDENGVVDDVHGAKFAETLNGEPLVSGDPRPPSDAESITFSHGTSSAGLIFAAPSSGLQGIAPGCKLMSVALLHSGSADETNNMPERVVIALDYALHMKARVSSISISFGYAMPTAFLELLEVAESIDHVVIASAGNNHCNCDDPSTRSGFPARHSLDYPAIIGVAATDNNDCLAIYNDANSTGCGHWNGSNFGQSTMLLGAPGWRNVSLRMLPLSASLGLYDWFGGTSAAAPHVAGAVALLLSIHPQYTCADVKAKLVQSGRAVDSLDGITVSGKTLDIGALINP